MWQMSHAALEANHDYIQWLFPTWNRSQFAPDAPVLDDEARDAFLHNPELQIRLLESLDLMLDFFGLENAGNLIRRSPAFPQRKQTWLSAGNHNHLRLTRIILSLWTLGCQKEAQLLHGCLHQITLDFLIV